MRAASKSNPRHLHKCEGVRNPSNLGTKIVSGKLLSEECGLLGMVRVYNTKPIESLKDPHELVLAHV